MVHFSTINDALQAFRAGQFVIAVDDEGRENEGDLLLAAEHITEEKMAFIIRHTGGVVCMPMSKAIADHFQLPLMVQSNGSKFGTPFTVSIEARKGVSTGISAADRAHTIQVAADPASGKEDLISPGHIFPLRAADGGVLQRAGHTEAVIDLCRLARLREVGVISELMHDNGTMMRVPDLQAFAAKHGIPLLSIADLIEYRRKHETLISKEAATNLETATGDWNISVYADSIHHKEHLALVMGTPELDKPVLVRMHSECITGDVFDSRHCDCGPQLRKSMQIIREAGQGVIVYLRQEGRGIGLANKVKAYELQHLGLDTIEANVKLGFPEDLREYGIGAQILHDLGIRKIRLLTNNPKKVVGLEGYGLEIVETLPIEMTPVSEKQKKYLKTKKEKMQHTITTI